MKNLIIFCFVAFLGQSAFAQQSPATAPPQNAQFKVLGNCGMCRKTIEKAALGAGATTATWDMNTDLLAVAFDEKKTTTDAIQKAIAKAGYDNAGYKADDNAYNNLHGCCQYDRTGAAVGTKTCTDNK
ncbi:MAG: cation transporter [Lewinellaceae bacterium]|jgi:mercuric ion binding protein|nr:cation transporter [Lewinellaceae bacterium]